MSLEALRRNLFSVLNQAEPAIVARGRDGVQNIMHFEVEERQTQSTIVASVLGSEMYYLQLGEANRDMLCSCPYFGKDHRICKHLVAIALRGISELKHLPVSSLPEIPQETQKWEPKPILKLKYDQKQGQLICFFRFQYPPGLSLHTCNKSKGDILDFDEEGNRYFVKRDYAAEQRYLTEIDDLLRNEMWSLLLRNDLLRVDDRHVPAFIHRVLEPLQKNATWFLDGITHINRFRTHTAKISLIISSGIDWFDLQGKVQFGENEALLQDLMNLAPNEDEITLTDGSRGILPRDFVRLLRIIQGLREKNANADAPLRILAMHALALKPLLENPVYHIEKREELKTQLEARALKPIAPKEAPMQLKANLRAYQQEGLHWLRQMRAWGTGGILADDMGLGKTVQVLAALCDFYEDLKETRPSLIVMPTSLLHNWKRELERFTPHLDCQIYHGSDKTEFKSSTPPQRTLIFTSYALLRNEFALWSAIDFGYVILDESQAIKNPASQSALCARGLRASHRLAMTGTPIENSLLDLWSQFAFTNPGLLGSKEFFRKEFMSNGKDAPSPTVLDLLAKLSAPFYLRRTKEKVLTELPPLEERVLYVDMTTPQRALYEKTKEKYRTMILGTIKEKGIQKSQIHIIEGMLRLRQISCDPRLYMESSKAGSAKLDLLVEKLQEDVIENHKALVFSQFTTLLDYCGKALKAAKIDFAYLDGSTRDRAMAIEEFTSQSNKRVFLISLKAGGTGLNLTTADYVFHLDPWWNPAVESQATGRAHRMGQKNTVQSIKMVASNSIEEKILQLQEGKRKLAAAVLQSDQGFVKSLDLAMVRELFG